MNGTITPLLITQYTSQNSTLTCQLDWCCYSGNLIIVFVSRSLGIILHQHESMSSTQSSVQWMNSVRKQRAPCSAQPHNCLCLCPSQDLGHDPLPNWVIHQVTSAVNTGLFLHCLLCTWLKMFVPGREQFLSGSTCTCIRQSCVIDCSFSPWKFELENLMATIPLSSLAV